MPLWILLFVVLAFPVAEAVSLFWLAGKIGWWALAWVAATFVIGLWLIRFERLAFGPRLLFNLQMGHHPLRALLSSTRLFVAGALLMFPGPISDALAGGLLMFPGTWRRPPPPSRRAANDDVIEGEFRRETEAIADRFPRRDS